MVDGYEMHTSVQDERTLPWMTARHWVPALIRWPTSKQRPLVGLAHRFCHCPKWRAAPEHRANNVCFMVFLIHGAPFLQKSSKSSRVNLHYAFLHLQLHGFMLFFSLHVSSKMVLSNSGLQQQLATFQQPCGHIPSSTLWQLTKLDLGMTEARGSGTPPTHRWWHGWHGWIYNDM